MTIRFFIALCCLFVKISYSKTLNVPGDYITIQAAIDTSQNGDTVLVDKGIYYEHLRIIEKNIVLASKYLFSGDTSIISSTVINGYDLQNVFYIDRCNNLTLMGFTITKGSSGWGGGIHCRNSVIVLNGLNIDNNYGNRAAGLYLYNSVCNMKDLSVKDNVSNYSESSGIYCEGSQVFIRKSVLMGNNRGGLHCQNSTITLDSCKVAQNVSGNVDSGFGIHGYQSTVTINDCKVYGNSAMGILLSDCRSVISNSLIYGNRSHGINLSGQDIVWNVKVFGNQGSGISSRGFLKIYDSSIYDNTSTWSGGGIQLSSSLDYVYIINTKIYSNSAREQGGGLSFFGIRPLYLENVTISDNYAARGGGVYLEYSPKFQFKKTTITQNKAKKGGGFYIASGINNFEFDSLSIYSNYAGQGNEFYYQNNTRDENPLLKAVIDTFTSSEITNDYIFPKEYFNFEINNYKQQKRYVKDIYISPDGSDLNDGLSAGQPLKTILKAFSFVKTDSLNNTAIHFGPGEYSASDSDIFFPVNMMSYTCFKGSGSDVTIFKADSFSHILDFNRDRSIGIQNMTLSGAHGSDGGAIFAEESAFRMDSVRFINNTAVNGAAIYLKESSLTANYLQLSENAASSFAGAMYIHNSDVSLNFSSLTQNNAFNGGALVFDNNCWVNVYRTLIANNTAESRGGAVFSTSEANFRLVNSTLANNTAGSRGGNYYGWSSKALIVNSILWHGLPSEVYLSTARDSVFVYYSNIMAGADRMDANDRGFIHWDISNLESDPLFYDAGKDNYSLSNNSALINAGIPFFSFAGDTLLNLLTDDYVGSAPDIGVFEYEWADNLGEEELMSGFSLLQNYPNPFNNATIINYQLSMPGDVKLLVYDVLGRKVKTLLDKKQNPGRYHMTFDASGLASGIYYYRLKAAGFEQTRKMLLLK